MCLKVNRSLWLHMSPELISLEPPSELVCISYWLWCLLFPVKFVFQTYFKLKSFFLKFLLVYKDYFVLDLILYGLKWPRDCCVTKDD